jgi:hypothetical protein
LALYSFVFLFFVYCISLIRRLTSIKIINHFPDIVSLILKIIMLFHQTFFSFKFKSNGSILGCNFHRIASLAVQESCRVCSCVAVDRCLNCSVGIHDLVGPGIHHVVLSTVDNHPKNFLAICLLGKSLMIPIHPDSFGVADSCHGFDSWEVAPSC